MVKVSSPIPNVIHIRIRRGKHNDNGNKIPLSIIRSNLKAGAQYDSLLVKNGRLNLDVLAIKDGDTPKKPSALLKSQLNNSGAYINGGFYVHRNGLKTSTGKDAKIGYTIGETKGKNNTIPVAVEWKNDFGTLTDNNDSVILTSGPVLDETSTFEGDRFTYFKPSNGTDNLEANELNKYAGALTHSSNSNERAAITTGTKDVRMQTVTTNKGERNLGVTMKEWSDMVNAIPLEGYSLNLDGAASINMGYISDNETHLISKGGGKDSEERDLEDMVITSS